MTDGGGCSRVCGSSSSRSDADESRGLNLRSTVVCSGMQKWSRGLISSKMGGSAGEKAEAGGVRLLVEREEMDELELPNSGSLRLGDSDSASPDFRPCDRDMEAFAPAK